MRAERKKDIIDWRSDRAKKIVKEFNKIKFRFNLVSDQEYGLGPYEIIRVVNIIATSNRIGRSLRGFEKFIKRKEEAYKLPDWSKPKGGLNI